MSKPTYEELEKRVKEFENAEKTVRESEELVSELVKSSPVAIYRCEAFDPFSTTFMSNNVTSQMGYTPKDFIDDSGFWANHIHPDDKNRVFTGLVSLFKIDKHEHEYRFLCKDGTYRWMYDQLKLLRDSDGNPVSIIGNWIDITERRNAEEVMKKSQLFNETILNSSPDVIYVYDIVEKSNVYSNDGIMNVLGYTAQDMKDMGDRMIEKLMHPDDFAVYLNKTLPRYHSAENNENIEHEFRMKHHNGEWRWLHAKESIFRRNKDGTPNQIFGIIRNITERRKAEEELSSVHEKLSGFMESATEGFVLYSSDLKLEMINEASLKMINRKRKDVIGKDLLEISPSLKGSERYDKYRDVLKTGKPFSIEEKVVMPGVGEVHYRINAFMVGKGIGFTFSDITERKKTEEKLQRVMAAFESASDAICIFDSQGCQVY